MLAVFEACSKTKNKQQQCNLTMRNAIDNELVICICIHIHI